MKTGRGRYWLLLVFIVALGVLIPPMVQADEGTDASATVSTQDQENDDKDETMFYAFLEADNSQSHGPLLEMLKGRVGVQNLLQPHTKIERKFRPMMQWRRWADKRQRFFPSFLFIFGLSFLYWFVMPGIMQSSAEECKSSYWKSFGTGVLLATIVLSLMRSVFVSQFGWPFGIVLAGTSQAAMLAGLAVAIYNFGHSVILLSGLKRLHFFSSRPKLLRACDIFAGAFLSALILQIPGGGLLPRIGTRLLALFALLGVGAICRVLKKRQSYVA